jgi:hypothetical protein
LFFYFFIFLKIFFFIFLCGVTRKRHPNLAWRSLPREGALGGYRFRYGLNRLREVPFLAL